MRRGITKRLEHPVSSLWQFHVYISQRLFAEERWGHLNRCFSLLAGGCVFIWRHHV